MFKNKEGKVRSGWKIAAVSAAFFLISNIIGAIIGVIYSFILMANGDIDLTTGVINENVSNHMLAQLTLVSTFIGEIVMLLTPIIAWKYLMKRPLSHMGLTSFKKNYKDLLIGLVIGAISLSIVFAILVFTGNASVESWTPRFSADTIIYLGLFILVGLAEEIYGRGFIMSALRQTRNLPVVVIVSSLIFALLHSANSGIGPIPYLNLFLIGILFAYMYIKSGNIWMCIGYHITWNYFQGNVFGFKVSGQDTNGLFSTTYNNNNIFNGGTFGPEGGLFVTIIILFGFLFVKLYYKESSFDFIAAEPVAVIPKQPVNTEPVLQTEEVEADQATTNTDGIN